MRLDNLLSLRYKPFVPRTTDSAHGYEIVCDLTREAMLTAPDHVWVADITYIRLAEEFVYLAVVMDAFSRKVVGWALADHLQASLPLEALDKAIASRGGSLKDLIHHSHRGVQYACRDYALRLSQIGALSSKTNSDKLRNVKQTNLCPCHRISRVSPEGRSPLGGVRYRGFRDIGDLGSERLASQ